MRRKTVTEVGLRVFPQQLRFVCLLWNCRGWWRACPLDRTRERHGFYCLLIPITSCGRPAFLVVSCHDFLVQDRVNLHTLSPETKELYFSLERSLCADMGNNDTGILLRSARGVEPLCFPCSHKALFHMNPCGFPTAAVFTESNRGRVICSSQKIV